MVGDSLDVVWGVMDIYFCINFLDICKKVVINLVVGNIFFILREGDFMVCFYIEFFVGIKVSDVSFEKLYDYVCKVFYFYEMDFVEIFWWLVYFIG